MGDGAGGQTGRARAVRAPERPRAAAERCVRGCRACWVPRRPARWMLIRHASTHAAVLAPSGVPRAFGPQPVLGSLSVSPGLGAEWLPPVQSTGNRLGVVGPWLFGFSPWVPCRPRLRVPFPSPAPSVLLGACGRGGGVAVDTRRPKALPEPVFPAKLIFV